MTSAERATIWEMKAVQGIEPRMTLEVRMISLRAHAGMAGILRYEQGSDGVSDSILLLVS